MSAVEQYARAHIVTDAAQDPPAVPVALRYDPEADPRRVHIMLPGHHEWVFARDLLEQGLRAPAAAGDVRIWPCGRVQAVMGGLRQHQRSLLCQHLRRVGQRQTRSHLRPAAQARAEAVRFRQRGVGEEAAVLAPRQPHPAYRPAIDAGGRDADEQPPIEAGIAGGDHAVGSVVVQCHDGHDRWQPTPDSPFSDLWLGAGGRKGGSE